MKKLLTTLTLSSALLLAACGGEDTTDTTEDTATDEGTEQVEETEETTDTTGDTEGTDEATASELQDGTYRIEELNFGSTGWKEALEITVENGEVAEANFESVDEEGNNKIEDEEYQESMASVDGVGPQDFIPELEGQLEGAQSAEAASDVEVVSGATGTSEKFQDYAQQLLDAAAEGNTETIEVDNSEEE